jgi:4-hydroxybenzoate polyprenyltransferase
MRVGPPKAKITAALLLGLAVILSPLPYFFGALDMGYLAVIGMANVAFVWTMVMLFRVTGAIVEGQGDVGAALAPLISAVKTQP